MFDLWKKLYWELRDKYGRFSFINGFLMNVPGRFGVAWRSRVIPKYFASHGDDVTIGMGTRFRGLHELNVGNRVGIGAYNFLQASGGITIGDDVIFGPGVKIWSINHRVADTEIPIRDQGYDYEPVHLETGCWLGANVFVMPGVHLPEGCVVSACSVVGKKKYPPYAILAGHPARVIGVRQPQPSSSEENQEASK